MMCLRSCLKIIAAGNIPAESESYRLSNFFRNSVIVLDQAFATAKGVSRGTRDFRVIFLESLGKSYNTEV